MTESNRSRRQSGHRYDQIIKAKQSTMTLPAPMDRINGLQAQWFARSFEAQFSNALILMKDMQGQSPIYPVTIPNFDIRFSSRHIINSLYEMKLKQLFAALEVYFRFHFIVIPIPPHPHGVIHRFVHCLIDHILPHRKLNLGEWSSLRTLVAIASNSILLSNWIQVAPINLA